MLALSRTLVCAAALLAIPAPGHADVTAKDVQVAARTFGFLATKPTGSLTLAIVYAPAIADSKAEADALSGLLGSGLAAGGVTLVPSLVPVDQLAKLAGAGAVFVTAGLSAHQDAVFAAAKAAKLLTMATDMGCVQSGKCVLGVRAEPKVQIVVNKAAAEACQIGFQPAFRMMISEI